MYRCYCTVAGIRIGTIFVMTVIFSIPLSIYILLPLITVTKLDETYTFLTHFTGKKLGVNNNKMAASTAVSSVAKKKLQTMSPFLSSFLQDKWEIHKNGVPNVVHLMWCQENGGGNFTFLNYLAAKGALSTFQPDILIFHYVKKLPEIDLFRYNTWLDELNETVHNFIINKDDSLPEYCGSMSKLQQIYANPNGVFIGANLVVTPTILAKEVQMDRINVSSAAFLCSQLSLATTSHLPICFSINEDEEDQLYPAASFEAQSPFARFLRRSVYGTEEPLILQKNPDTLVPLICHYIWLGGGSLEFLLYLSILSCLNVVNADAVLIHGDEEPRGDLWKLLAQNYPARVVYIYRPQQKTVFGRPVTKLSPMSDVLRMDILLKYGGLYTDWDAIWVKPLDASIRQYESVVSFDWPAHLKPYPDTLNLGVMITKPNAAYLRHLQESLHDYVDGVGPIQWCYICLKAYKVYERYPQTVRLDRHLQVIAYQGYYHPAWVPGFKEIKFKPPPDAFDWRRGDTYALHWTWPTPVELRGLKLLRQSNTTAADAARYILHESGINWYN